MQNFFLMGDDMGRGVIPGTIYGKFHVVIYLSHILH